MLQGIRVIEVAGEMAEFAGKLLAGLGADVIKVEPPGGSITRRLGPFYSAPDGTQHSLYFWHYNTGKSSVVLDFESDHGRATFERLVAASDVLLESLSRGQLDQLDIDNDHLTTLNPRLVHVSVTPFGREGPMGTWQSSDLVSLALGGATMMTGYTGDASSGLLPPITPQLWHASHITGAHAVLATLGALHAVDRFGVGQHFDVSVHRSVNFDTIADIPTWQCNRQLVQRQTAQYAAPGKMRENLLRSRDGRYILNYLYQPRHYVALARLLQDIGRPVAGVALDDDPKQTLSPGQCADIDEAARSWIGSADFSDESWRLAHNYRLNWAPVREPADALADPYWRERGSLVDIHHKEVGRTFTYPDQPWIASRTPWRAGRPAPQIGEHNDVLTTLDRRTRSSSPHRPSHTGDSIRGMSRLPLKDVRIVDMTWIVAGAGATRILAALGAETIKVEWRDNLDALRLSGPVIPGRPTSGVDEINRRSLFADMNAGKLSLSLNMKTDEGREMLKRLVQQSDVVVENLAPGALERAGLGYDELVRANPEIIFAQLSGFGQNNRHSDFISTAPVAEAFAGLTSQSGLPEPAPPAGWGYPYIDIASSYYLAMALLGALYHRRSTGEGQRIDCSLADTGLFLTSTALLDYQANGRTAPRRGNRAASLPAAPHGIYPCRGDDRWLAISVLDDAQWCNLAGVLDNGGSLSADPRFGSLTGRLEFEEELDDRLGALTRPWDAYELMARLQAAGVPAGVCQTSEDRIEHDPQLRHDRVFVPLPSPGVGQWQIRDIPWRTSQTDPSAGGRFGRGFPSYGEDTSYVLSQLLGLTVSEIDELAKRSVV